MDECFENELAKALDPLGILPDEKQTDSIRRYLSLLNEWNKNINLISEKSMEDVIRRHIADSLTIVFALPDWESISYGKSVIDVGTGAGLPGIPLKIFYPSIHLTLLDSLAKRVSFLKTVTEKLNLDNTQALWGRAEDMGRDTDLRESFDFCVSRAVAALPVLSEYCLPFVRVGGLFAAYKSADADDELKAAERAVELLGGKVRDVAKFSEDGNLRSIIVIEKISATPEKYPRKAGKPAKKPL